jgi:hypothetical protein
MTLPLRSTLLLALLAPAAACLAADGPTITMSGFGTAAATATNSDDAQFKRPIQNDGTGKDWSTSPDSMLGMQASVKFNDSLSATVQGLVSQSIHEHFGAQLTWAFLKYKANEELAFRVGRIRPPVYMVSEFVNVGYANTMMRPPAETYSQADIQSFEGADVVWQRSFGDSTLTLQFGAGTTTPPSAVAAHLDFKPLTALHVQLENGPFAVRLGRVDTKFSLVDDPGFNTLRATLLAAGLNQAAEDFKFTDAKVSFTALGATLDYNNFLVQTEYAVRKADTRAVPDTTSWYMMLGRRFGKITPYYYYGKIKQDVARTYDGVPAAGPLAPIAGLLNVLAKTGLQSTNALGVRWDFHKAAALKAQVDRIKPEDGAGLFAHPKPGFAGPVNVYAVGIDFVF